MNQKKSTIRGLLNFKVALIISGMVLSICIAAYTWAITYGQSEWSSETRVKKHILSFTPMGSSVEEVRAVMVAQHWQKWYEKELHQDPDRPNAYPGVRGNYAIGVDFGKHFGLPFSYSVDAYWGFDQNGKMIDLKVRVMPQGL